jgi:hypothetical protein
MEKVVSDIAAVEVAIAGVEDKLKYEAISKEDKEYWRQEKHDLRQEKLALRQKELALINSQAPGMFSL